jgi:hypothetical protein
MVSKKVEGNEEQRRKAARDARRRGKAPSATQSTTGASKQEAHRRHARDHDERIESLDRGKQQAQGPQPRPHSVPDREPARRR